MEGNTVQANQSLDKNNQDLIKFIEEKIEIASLYLLEGNTESALDVLNECRRTPVEDELYQAVGKLTRSLHESISRFGNPLDLENEDAENKAKSEAHNHINYVIQLTENSANTILDKIENSVKYVNTIEEKVGSLQSNKSKNTSQEEKLLSEILTQNANIRTNLTDIICAQEYQDLTAQTLEKTEKIITQLEIDLVNIMKMASKVDTITGTTHEIHTEQSDSHDISEEGILMQINHLDDPESLQDNVDDLLKQLGF